MNRQQLRELVLREVQDLNGVYFTNAQVNDLLNEGQRQFVRETRILRNTAYLNIVAQQAEYDLSAISPEVIEVLTVAAPQSAAATDPYALRYMTWEELEADDKMWRTQVGVPLAYMRYSEGPQRIRIYPIPDSSFSPVATAPAVAYSGTYGIPGSVTGLSDAQWTATYGVPSSTQVVFGALTIDYVASPTDMTQDTDVPSIPSDFHEALYFYAVSRLCEFDIQISQVQKLPLYQSKYAAMVGRARQLSSGGYQRKPNRSTAVREF